MAAETSLIGKAIFAVYQREGALGFLKPGLGNRRLLSPSSTG
jgi:hypothetical protein